MKKVATSERRPSSSNGSQSMCSQTFNIAGKRALFKLQQLNTDNQTLCNVLLREKDSDSLSGVWKYGKKDILVLDILLESRQRKLTHWFTRNRKVNIKDSGIISGQISLYIDIHLSGDTPKFEVMY